MPRSLSTVAITGASGHVGVNLIRALLQEGCRVRALVYPGTSVPEDLDVEAVTGDVLDPTCLREVFSGVDVVFHLAAVITLSPREDPVARRVNVEGTRNVIAACRECGVDRLVHFSSIHAYSAYPVDGVIDETRPLCDPAKAMPYDRYKAESERLVMKAAEDGLDAVVVNPTGVLGPYDYQPSRMGHVILDLALRRLPALLAGGFNWVDVRDVCAGAIAAARLGRKGERYLLSGHHVPLDEFAMLVEEVTGVKRPAFCLPMWMGYLAIPFAAAQSRFTGKPPRVTRVSLFALEHHQKVSHAKAARELGYNPRPIRETIADTVAWFKEAGRL